jgi:hypothetical protein
MTMAELLPVLFICARLGAAYGALWGAIYGNTVFPYYGATQGLVCGAVGGAVAGIIGGLTGGTRCAGVAGLIGGGVAGGIALASQALHGDPVGWPRLVFCLVVPSLIGGAFGRALQAAESRRAYWVPGLASATAAVNAYHRLQRRRNS